MRRARGSNPQPLTGQLISNLASSVACTEKGEDFEESAAPRLALPPDADLAIVAANWKRLPAAVKGAIVATVQAIIER